MGASLLSKRFHTLLLAPLVLLPLALSSATAPAHWPESLATIDSLDGRVLLNDSPATKHQSFTPEGSTLIIGDNSFATIVLSSGIALYCGPGTHLTFQNARQEALTTTYAADHYESTRSHTTLQVTSGTLGVNRPSPNPASNFSLITRFGEIQSNAESFTLTLEPGQNLVAAFEGNLRFIPATANPRRFVTAGEMLNLTEASRGGSALALSPLHANYRLLLITPALKARHSAERTAYVIENDQQGTFRNALPAENLGGTAYNDHRFPR